MKIVLATRNKKKLREIQRIFSETGIEFLTLDLFPDCPEVVEDGKTFRANAVKKAVQTAKHTNYPAIADDSGLQVHALGGDPGVFSARYAGEKASDQENVYKLLSSMKKLKTQEDRAARFVCCIAFAFPDGNCKTVYGYAKGSIGKKQKGSNGFGYDPVFYPEGFEKTFAELTGPEKDTLSHRGQALKKLYKHIREIAEKI